MRSVPVSIFLEFRRAQVLDREEARRAAVELTSRGAALAEQGRLDEAARYFSQAAATDLHLVEAHENLAICLEMLGELRSAASTWKRVLAAKPADLKTLHKLGGLSVR